MKTPVRRIPDIPESDVKPGQFWWSTPTGTILLMERRDRDGRLGSASRLLCEELGIEAEYVGTSVKFRYRYFRLSIDGVVVHPFINDPSDWLRGFKAARDFATR